MIKQKRVPFKNHGDAFGTLYSGGSGREKCKHHTTLIRKAWLIFIVAFILFATCIQVNAGRAILVTYDISGSMYSTEGKDRFFLSAGEFKNLAKAVTYLIFTGDPLEYPDFMRVRNGMFFSNGKSLSASTRGPFWEEGTRIYYYEYCESNKQIYVSDPEVRSPDVLQNELLEQLPFPRNISSDAQSLSDPKARYAFRKAFPGDASLQKFSELTAFEIFDEVVNRSDTEPEVIWIRVSDEDIDTTENKIFKDTEDRIRAQLASYKTKYENSKMEWLYQFKAGERIWVDVNRLAFSPIKALMDENSRLQAELDRANALKKQKRVELEDENSRLQAELDHTKTLNKQKHGMALMINNQCWEEGAVDHRLKFKRVKMPVNESANSMKKAYYYTTDKIRLAPAEGAAETDYDISKVEWEIQASNSSPITDQCGILGRTVIGKPLEFKIKESEELINRGKQAFISVTYTHLPTKQPVTKTWVLNNTVFSGPGFFEIFWWLLPIACLMIAAMVIVIMLKKGNVHHVQSPVGEEDDPISDPNDLLGAGSIGDSAILGEEITDDSSVDPQTAVSTLHSVKLSTDHNGPDIYTLIEGRKVYLYRDDLLLDGDVWDLNCPDQIIALKAGVVYHNDREVNSKHITLEDASGSTFRIKVK